MKNKPKKNHPWRGYQITPQDTSIPERLTSSERYKIHEQLGGKSGHKSRSIKEISLRYYQPIN